MNLLPMVLECKKSKIMVLFGVQERPVPFASRLLLLHCTLTVVDQRRSAPHGLRYLNTWSPSDGTIWGGDAAFLEELRPWGQDLGDYSQLDTRCGHL